MHSIAVCCSCGRTIEKKFVYCPWCGAAAASVQYKNMPNFSEMLFQEVRCISPDNRDQRICRLENSLNQLEADLSRFISQSVC